MKLYFNKMTCLSLLLFWSTLHAQDIPITGLDSDPDDIILEEVLPIDDRVSGYNSRLIDRIHSKNKLYGYYNKKGKLSVPHKYAYLDLINDRSLLIVRDKNRKHGVIDLNDNVSVDIIYDQITELRHPDILFIATLNNDYLLLNKKGEILVDNNYIGYRETSDPNRVVAIYEKPNRKRATVIVDTLGTVIQKFDFRDLFQVGRNDNYLFTRNNAYRHGVVTKENKEILPAIYKLIDYIEFDRWRVKDTLNKVGIVDNSNTTIIPFLYDRIESSKVKDKKTFFYVYDKSQVSVVNDKGKTLLPFGNYDRVEIHRNHYFIVKKGKKYGLHNWKGKRIKGMDTLLIKTLPCFTGDEVQTPSLLIEGKNGNYALFSNKLKKLTDFDYERNLYCRNRENYYTAIKNGKHGVLDDQGNEITPFIYDKVIIDIGDIYGIKNGVKTLLKSG